MDSQENISKFSNTITKKVQNIDKIVYSLTHIRKQDLDLKCQVRANMGLGVRERELLD